MSDVSALKHVTPSANFVTTALSGDDYHVHMQMCNGSWQRRWVFHPPEFGSSACGSVAYSYIEVYLNVATEDYTKEYPLSAGTYLQQQEITYTSNSASGGFGTSGTFSTPVAGFIRRLPSTLSANDPSGVSLKEKTLVVAKQVGAYDASLDTSATFAGNFYQDVLLPASRECVTFKPDLVNL